MIMKKLLVTIILLTVCSVHAQTDERETLKQINQQVVSSYQNQKLDEAIKFGQQAVDLSIKIYGRDNRETAAAFTNLGVIYRDKKKFKESIENLQKAVEVYRKIPNLTKELIGVYEALAFSQLLDGKQAESEANYLQAIEIAETAFGKESKESFLPTLNLANFYARDKKFEKADEFYLKSYALAVKNFGRETERLTLIEDARSCLVGSNINLEKNKIFDEERIKIYGEKISKGNPDVINGGIINGKAKSLPKPAYPSEARAQRLGGMISVRVKIDEQGNVMEAKTICGHPILGKASEDSARKAKFVPTMLGGKLVKVVGILVYSFVP